MADTTRHVYVYYRVAADTAAAREAVAALFRSVEAKTGVIGRLLARCDDPHTWMEVYAPVAALAPFRRSLASLARRHGVVELAADGTRHVECFAPPAATPTPAKPRSSR